MKKTLFVILSAAAISSLLVGCSESGKETEYHFDLTPPAIQFEPTEETFVVELIPEVEIVTESNTTEPSPTEPRSPQSSEVVLLENPSVEELFDGVWENIMTSEWVSMKSTCRNEYGIVIENVMNNKTGEGFFCQAQGDFDSNGQIREEFYAYIQET